MKFARSLAPRNLCPALLLLCAVGVLVAAAVLAGTDTTPAGVRPSSDTSAAAARETYARLPLSFEANRGQTDASVDFVARGSGYALFLRPSEAVFVLARDGGAAHDRTTETVATRAAREDEAGAQSPPAVLRMKLVGADARAAAAGADELAGRVNYFVGDDPAAWRTAVPTFERVRYEGVYPGIDLVYYGNQRQLEYDFHVAPGRDPGAVRLRFEGADALELDAAGDLLLSVGGGVVRQPKPFIYQEVAGARREVEGGYVVGEGDRVGFAVGEYDPALPLVIDPVIHYSTYLGGSGTEEGTDIRVDSSGNIYVCGRTTSTNFPTANAFQNTFAGATFEGGFDGFITKLNAAGSAFVFSTYFGGGGDDRCNSVAADSTGNVYVAGETTSSTDFPRANALQNTFGGGLSDAFVAKLNAVGSALVYSTYLGGSIFDAASGLALDSSNNVYLTGRTTSANFPTANAIQAAQASQFADAFVTKINAAGNALVYSTYLGGSGGEAFDAGFSIAVDSVGNAYLTGQTTSTNFPTVNAIQSTFGGGFPDGDVFVTKVNAEGSAFIYSTYLGGAANDIGFEIAADSAGSTYVAGVTRSANFPTANALQSTLNGPSDAFVAKLNTAGSAFAYSTYFGGSGDDSANGIAVSADGEAYLAGGTTSTNLPTLNPTQGASGGGVDAFVTRLNAAGSALIFSTYLGGGGAEAALNMALGASGRMYVAGRTTSTNFPVVTPIQSANGGDQDTFITVIFPDAPTPSPTPTPQTFQFEQASYSVTEGVTFVTVAVTRAGDTAAAATVDFETSDATASERQDYTTAVGTLRFAAGESRQTLDLLVNEDSKVEGAETFTVVLENPTGGFALGTPAAATVRINDDASEPPGNRIDDPSIFVAQHYHDFLHRQHDFQGHQFWTTQVANCGADDACRDRKRQDVSAAFFLSIEFQETGYRVLRVYKSSFVDTPQRPRGLPRYREFLRDMREVHRGVVVGVGNWEEQLQANTVAFARDWVQRAEFVALFPVTMTAAQFVDKLFQNAEVTPTTAERNAAVAAFGAGGTEGRADALLSVADSGSVYNRQFNCGFVLMQYFGYLRRNPNDAPDNSYAGLDFWIDKLDSFTRPGEDARDQTVALRRIRRAEMVKAFLISTEYRQRFGQ